MTAQARLVSEFAPVMLPPEARLMDMIQGAYVTNMLSTAVQMGVFSRLAESPASASELARVAETLPEPTYRLLRALTLVDVVTEGPGQVFELSTLGRLLAPGEGSFAALALLNGSEWGQGFISELMHSMKTGESAFRKHNGAGLFEWLASRPKQQAMFSEAMSTFSGVEIGCVLEAYNFGAHKHVVDVAGAHGDLISAILKAHPLLEGTLFDVNAVIERAKGQLRAAGLEARCQTAVGDFFHAVPTGGDLYIVKHILHDWDDERALSILRSISAAMPPGGRLLVVEQGIAPPGVPNPGKLLDVIMLAMLEGGKERTAEEHALLMGQAGITFERAIETPGPIMLFLGSK